MRRVAEPVLRGFETGFALQVSSHAIACTEVRDRAFSTMSHKSCSVHGGDGLALVIHGDPAGPTALGRGGGDLGYGGLQDALVVEFDTWYNAGPVTLDLLQDHVSVQASSMRTGARVGPGIAARLGMARPAALADGAVHRVKVVYVPYVETAWLPSFMGSPSLVPLLVDGGKGVAWEHLGCSWTT